jgi:hypothetical protein
MVEREFKTYTPEQVESLIDSFIELTITTIEKAERGNLEAIRTFASDIVFAIDTARLVDKVNAKDTVYTVSFRSWNDCEVVAVFDNYSKVIEYIEGKGFSLEHPHPYLIKEMKIR